MSRSNNILLMSLCVLLVFASVGAAPREKRQLFGGVLGGFLGDGGYQGNPQGGFGYNHGYGNYYGGYNQGFRRYRGIGRGSHERF